MNYTLTNAVSVSFTGVPTAFKDDAEILAHFKREEERINHCLSIMGEVQSIDSLKNEPDVPSFTWEDVGDPLTKTWYNALNAIIKPTSKIPSTEVGWYTNRDGDPYMYSYGGYVEEVYYILPGMQEARDTLMRRVDCLERMRIVNLVDARGAHPKANINCTPLRAVVMKYILGDSND